MATISTLVICAAAAVSLVSACPGEYEPWVGGRCLRLTSAAERAPQLRSNCRRDSGELVSIHSAVENDRIRNTVSGETYVTIGLSCDGSTHEYFWLDGSPLDYSRIGSTCKTDYTVVLRVFDGVWLEVSKDNSYKGICASPHKSNVACNDYDEVKGAQACVSLRNAMSKWNDAEAACSKESATLMTIHDQATNDFVSAKAKELGLLEGVHIGLQTSSARNEKNWIDGSNFTYDNFANGFPNDRFGKCTALETHSHLGEWISVPCEGSQLQYACGRPAYDASHPIGPAKCLDHQFFEDSGTLYSPSYPGPANVATCDYILSVNADSRVHITFDDIDLNTCCDSIHIFEGRHRGDRIALLTGEPQAGLSFSTNSSNVMRLSLSMTDGTLVRGFRARFRSLEKV